MSGWDRKSLADKGMGVEWKTIKTGFLAKSRDSRQSGFYIS